MKSIPVQDAVGSVLCHDITEIVPGVCKGPAFRRGHVIQPEDVEHLLRLGKEHLYVWEEEDGMVHEDEAAYRIAKAIAGKGLVYGEPKEGRINFSAAHRGLFSLNLELLDRLNSIPHITIATIHTLQGVAKGRNVAGTRVIPLSVPESSLTAVEGCCKNDPLLSVLPFEPQRIGIVTTGSEVFSGRIKDGFGPVLRKKLSTLDVSVLDQRFVPDDSEQTATAIEGFLDDGATMVVVTGGMSVDPDDKTPGAIKSVASEVVGYGAPVFPGAMFMVAYKGDVPILGLPGCVMYHKASIFDVLLPRLLAGVRLTRRDILSLAHGGFCEGCPECHYPACGFGKALF